MRHHQKAFAILDSAGNMSGDFLNVTNMPDPDGIIASTWVNRGSGPCSDRLQGLDTLRQAVRRATESRES
jgi:hypothetical protein